MIQIYGERNSCNNYLVKLIETNFRVEVTKSHQFPIYENGKIHIVLVKNPYAWLLSLWKKPHGPKRFRDKYVYLKFYEFIRAEWRKYSNAVERYNDIYLSYIDFLEDRGDVFLIESKELQANPEKILTDLANHYDLKLRGFKNIDKEVNSGGNLVGKFDRLNYYLNDGWKAKLTREDIDFINRIVSPTIFKYFDYERL